MAAHCQRIFDFMIRSFKIRNDGAVGNGKEKSTRDWIKEKLRRPDGKRPR
jgi:hypothetical protein